MPMYLVQASYTAQALATLARNPQDRTAGVAAVMEKFGGRLHHLFSALGDDNIVGLAEFPDDTTAAAAMAISAPGHLRAYQTTRLFTMEESMNAMRKANSVGYQAPS